MRRMAFAFALVGCLSLSACSGLDVDKKYALTGVALGAGAGAAIGAGVAAEPWGGAAIGALVGGVIGLLYEEYWQEEVDAQIEKLQQ